MCHFSFLQVSDFLWNPRTSDRDGSSALMNNPAVYIKWSDTFMNTWHTVTDRQHCALCSSVTGMSGFGLSCEDKHAFLASGCVHAQDLCIRSPYSSECNQTTKTLSNSFYTKILVSLLGDSDRIISSNTSPLPPASQECCHGVHNSYREHLVSSTQILEKKNSRPSWHPKLFYTAQQNTIGTYSGPN